MKNESALLEHFITAVTANGLRCDRLSLVHLYVTLKAHNSILIIGPAKSGKVALVRAFDQLLGDESTNRLQMMVGHARWASSTRDITKFVELQSRFNDNQILSLMAEASRSENRRRLFMACLTRITPFEIYRYLSASGFQFWPWMSHQKGTEPEVRMLPFPLNFRLFSTMDADYFRWWDRDLLANTGIVLWTGDISRPTIPPTQPANLRLDGTFLDACVRETPAAYHKLKRLLRGINEPFGPLLQVSDTMRAYGVQLPSPAVNQVVRYLANAWSNEGEGLFAASTRANLRVGLDMALMQQVLPWAAAVGQPSSELRQGLVKQLDGRFPKAANFARTWI